MDRRTFISRTVGGLLAAPLAARAQKSATPVIGFLSSGSSAQWASFVAAFHQGLNEGGYIEGKNVAIEYRWAEDHFDRLPALAASLVSRQVAVVLATGGAATLAAKAATSTIPIVYTGGVDPVGTGLVASLGRPGGNVTGVSMFAVELAAKRTELLHELVPKATMIALLINPEVGSDESNVRVVQEAARSLGLQVHVLRARTEQEIDAAFATLVRLRADALVVGPSPLFGNRRQHLVRLAARYAVPTVFDLREYVAAGGLMSYGPSLFGIYRQAGIYTGKILNGAKPAELPVLQPTKFELVINTTTAKALGLTIPQSLRMQAELIE